MRPVALTIAGSDPSGGAGIQADLKTFHQFGVYGMSVLTLVTVQNTQRVSAVETLAPDLLRGQFEAVMEDIPPQAIKTGALGTAENIRVIAECLRKSQVPLVVDPVMISKHGTRLMAPDADQVLFSTLFAQAFLITPNLPEAAALTGIAVTDEQSMRAAGQRLCGMGPKAVLVKGGHLEGQAVDILYHEGRFRTFTAPREQTQNTHGTGCTFSAAITAELAKGRDLEAAVDTAKRFISAAIATQPGLGKGFGPVNHHAVVP